MEAESTDDILGPKKLNYEFLLLVRDKKYAEALTLGRKSTFFCNKSPPIQSRQPFCAKVLYLHLKKSLLK
jgi:hypothetical protein